MPNLNAWSPQALGLLRIMTALLFLEHGVMKFFHFPVAQMQGALPPMLIAAGAIELVAGVLITFGLFTRLAAFIASGEMAFAYFIGHASKSFWPGVNLGDAAILYCFIFFYLVFAGPGAWAVDSLLSKNEPPPKPMA